MEFTHTTPTIDQLYFQGPRFRTAQPTLEIQNLMARGGSVKPIPSSTIDMSRPVAHTLNSTSETAQFFKAYWPYMVGGTLIIGTIFYYYYQKNKEENDSNPT